MSKTTQQENDELRTALQLAINSVDCASLDKEGNPLPWYIAARRALGKAMVQVIMSNVQALAPLGRG